MGEKKKGPMRKLTRIWCPLRTCVHNVNMRCIAPTIKLHLASSGKLTCNTYKKRSGWPPALDYFKKEIIEGWIEDNTKEGTEQEGSEQKEIEISPDKDEITATIDESES